MTRWRLTGGGELMLPTDVPVELDRAEAQRQALAELANVAYKQAAPSWVQRLIDWLIARASELAQRAADAAPGGWWGIFGLALLVGGLIAVVRWRLGPVARRAELTFTVEPETTAAQFRQRAEAAAAGERWEEAITQRMRALVRSAEERALITPRPGRTVDELAAEVSAQLPAAAPALSRAVAVFDQVRYGHKGGDDAGYVRVVVADNALGGAQQNVPTGVGR